MRPGSSGEGLITELDAYGGDGVRTKDPASAKAATAPKPTRSRHLPASEALVESPRVFEQMLTPEKTVSMRVPDGMPQAHPEQRQRQQKKKKRKKKERRRAS